MTPGGLSPVAFRSFCFRVSCTGCLRGHLSTKGRTMSNITLDELQARLPQLLQELLPGEEITITDHGQPVAQMKKVERTSWPCRAGCYKKADFRMAPDFDAPLEEFKEY